MILAAVLSAEVLVLVVDVRNVSSAERAVQALVARFGRRRHPRRECGRHITFRPEYVAQLLFLLFVLRGVAAMHQRDPEVWWNTFEVNIRRALNFFRCESCSVAMLPRSWFQLTLFPFSSAAATALEQSRGCYVAISSVGAQVRIPGISDMNISKHALNRFIEFIVLGSFLFTYFAWSLIASVVQSIPACVHLRSRPGSSVRVCMSRLESERPSIRSSCPQQRHSTSRLGARTGFPEGA
jgi:hypothetical protein